MSVIIPISGGIDSGYLLARALHRGQTVYPVMFDDGDMDHPEPRAAEAIYLHYRARYKSQVEPLRKLRIPLLDSLKVDYPINYVNQAQRDAMEHISYWSGYKALMYATTLAFGGAVAASEIQFGVNEWNEHFVDELPASARAFRETWVQLYPELQIPYIEFPLMGITKVEVVRAAHALAFPNHLAYSCFLDNGPCNECLGCKHRAAAFAEAGTVDLAPGVAR